MSRAPGAAGVMSEEDRAKACADINAFQREADRAFSGRLDFYVVMALCMVARELRLLRLGVKS